MIFSFFLTDLENSGREKRRRAQLRAPMFSTRPWRVLAAIISDILFRRGLVFALHFCFSLSVLNPLLDGSICSQFIELLYPYFPSSYQIFKAHLFALFNSRYFGIKKIEIYYLIFWNQFGFPEVRNFYNAFYHDIRGLMTYFCCGCVSNSLSRILNGSNGRRANKFWDTRASNIVVYVVRIT